MAGSCESLYWRVGTGLIGAICLMASGLSGPPCCAKDLPLAASDAAIHVNAARGQYRVTLTSPAWSLRGSVAGALRNIQYSSGHNSLGVYKQVRFTWGLAAHARIGTLRCYADSGLLLTGITGGSPKTIFPNFTSIPAHLRVLSFKNAVFAGPEFHTQADSVPWICFDRHADTVIMSPASEFLISRLSGNAITRMGAALNPGVSQQTAAKTRWTILVAGHGIEHTLMAWGHALDQLYHRPRIGNEGNEVLRNIGYWTDHGAYYYYNYLPKLGYAGTLEAVARQFVRHNVPLAYMELDSWWYRKSDRYVNGTLLKSMAGKFPPGRWNLYGGIWQYRASHQLFPQGLGAFEKKLGVPLVCHGRWIDPQSPYHKKYAISGVAPIDPAWWKSTVDYFARSGVIGYEQDWLNDIYQYSPAMQVSGAIGDAFTGHMAAALASHHMSLIYCMPLPRFFLQSARTPTLSMIRCSDDYFIQPRWYHFVYTSSLAHAMGLWPWTDTLMSRDTAGILLATLSAGPVGVGDQMGHQSWSNIKKVIRPDGRIVKPDVPLLPTDRTIMADAAGKHRPFVARTYSNAGIKTSYLFIWRKKGDRQSVRMAPSELGLSNQERYVVYNYFTHTIRAFNAGQAMRVHLRANQWQYDIVAPEQTDGLAIFGDLNQFVPMGRQRIADVALQHHTMTITAILAKGEHSVTLTGYSKHGISATVHNGSISTSADGGTGLFTITLRPGPGTPDVKEFHKIVREATVRLSIR